MERGLYAAATGMMAQQSLQDALAQNIANANTVGYKQDTPTFRAMHGMALRRLQDGLGSGPKVGELGTGVQQDKTYTDWQSGPIAVTGNDLDASLDSGQFLSVRTLRGPRYTRAGNLQVNGNGTLTNSGGQPILDTNNQEIKIPGSTPPKLDGAGNVLINGKAIARLKVVQAPQESLVKDGETLFAAINPNAVQPAARPALRVGTLEQSNVNVVSGMVRMITVSRGFDMAQRAIVTQDEMLKHAANDLAHT